MKNTGEGREGSRESAREEHREAGGARAKDRAVGVLGAHEVGGAGELRRPRAKATAESVLHK